MKILNLIEKSNTSQKETSDNVKQLLVKTNSLHEHHENLVQIVAAYARQNETLAQIVEANALQNSQNNARDAALKYYEKPEFINSAELLGINLRVDFVNLRVIFIKCFV